MLIPQLRLRRRLFLFLIFIANGLAFAAVDPGEILISEMNCVACHDVTNPIKARLASRQSPCLDEAHAVHISPRWIQAFLEDPQSTQPGTLMPDLLAHLEPAARQEAAEALTHYLVELRGTAKPVAVEASPAVVLSGKALYHRVGCVACHAPFGPPARSTENGDDSEGLEKLQKYSVPLGSLDQKYSVAELASFLQDPLKSRPGGRMPSMKLNATESQAIAAYLLRSKGVDAGRENPSPFVVDAVKAKRGQEHFEALNCAACHDGVGAGRKAKPMASLNGRQPAGCLGPRPKPGVPRFEISDRQRVVILAQLGHQEVLSEPLTAEQEITRTMTTLNCYACHARDRRGGADSLRRDYFAYLGSGESGDEGRIPPPLHKIGAKLRPEWMKSVLVEGASVRPFMATRMPLYGETNVTRLPSCFEAADAKADALPEPKPLPPSDTISALQTAQKMFSEGELNCTSCHGFNGKPAGSVAGVDLSSTGQRLKWDWFHRFLLNPQSIRSDTRMPAFWPEGKATNPKFFHGDPEKQISALWEFLSLDAPAEAAPQTRKTPK